MGFYIRKSVSAGPFRFNLSGSGLGLSVGVKGFRVGTGPRGNYVHMGRGGLYYRASLGGAHNQRRAPSGPSPAPPTSPASIETGNVMEMRPSDSSQLLEQINEKLALARLWPWTLAGGLLLSVLAAGQPQIASAAGSIFVLTAIVTAAAAYWDQQRKTVVVLYDLDVAPQQAFERLTHAFDDVAKAQCIWNIETSSHTDDWKRNAGATQLISRNPVRLTYRSPPIIKTNIAVPSIVGGRHTIYFFPDVVLVIDGRRAGAISYEQLSVQWCSSAYLEDGRVPSDAQVIGHSWRFVNKNGGPDRRFNNNRQIPRVNYQKMTLLGPGGFQKVLQISKNNDRSDFDSALNGLRTMVTQLQSHTSQHALALAGQ